MSERPFRSQGYLILVILIFVIVAVSNYHYYESGVEMIEAKHEMKMELVEQSLYSEIEHTDLVNDIIASHLRLKMKENTETLLRKYVQEPNVLEWDLHELKKEFGHMDIYIIDNDLRIVASSLDEEIGFDFKKFPDFSLQLRERLRSPEFYSDPINYSLSDSELKIYSYRPTPDFQYLLELSITISEVYPELAAMNVARWMEQFRDRYLFVRDLGVYRFDHGTGTAVAVLPSLLWSGAHISEEEKDAMVGAAAKTKQGQETLVAEGPERYTLKYLPYLREEEVDDERSWWGSYVLEIVYDDQSVFRALASQRTHFIISMIIISLLYFGFLFLVILALKYNRTMAYTDHLTKLPNRKKFDEVIEEEIGKATRRNTKLAVFFLDLRDFKDINDTYGHSAGDQILQELAERIRTRTCQNCFVSRLSGDEFTGLIPGSSIGQIVQGIEGLLEVFNEPFLLDSGKITVRGNIGVSIFPDHGSKAGELVVKADAAMYEAKRSFLDYWLYEDRRRRDPEREGASEQ